MPTSDPETLPVPAIAAVEFAELGNDEQKWINIIAADNRAEESAGGGGSKPEWTMLVIAVVASALATSGLMFAWLTTSYIPNAIARVNARVGAVETGVSKVGGEVATLRSQSNTAVQHVDDTLNGFLRDALQKLTRPTSVKEQSQANLQAAEALIVSAGAHDVPLAKEDMANLSRALDSLRTQKDAQVWSTIGTYISYKSRLLSAEATPSDKPCSFGSTQEGILDGQPTVVVRGLSVDGCTATLENSTWIDMTFRNARVHYSGGPISLHNVVFENCLFEFDMRRVPTSSGERFSSQVLLAPSLSRLVVNVD